MSGKRNLRPPLLGMDRSEPTRDEDGRHIIPFGKKMLPSVERKSAYSQESIFHVYDGEGDKNGSVPIEHLPEQKREAYVASTIDTYGIGSATLIAKGILDAHIRSIEAMYEDDPERAANLLIDLINELSHRTASV